jgi:hypothetical protein
VVLPATTSNAYRLSNVLRCPRSGFFPQIVVPYRYSQTIDFPEDHNTVIVFHADVRKPSANGMALSTSRK